MRNTGICLLILSLLMFIGNSFEVQSQNADELLRKMDEAMFAAKDSKSKIKMVLTDKNGNQKTREAVAKQKGPDMRIFKFTSPSSQAGIAFLSLPGDIMYLYLPAFGKERRIASHVKNQGFAGTDFSYGDMESKTYSESYNASLVENRSGEYLIDLIPKDLGKSEYMKLTVKLDKASFYPLRISFFDKNGIMIKELVNERIEKIDGYWVALEMTMTNLKKNHKTQMFLSEVSNDNGFDDSEFTVRKLKQ